MATWLHAETEYSRALDVALQWFAQWHASKSQRDLDTAMACAQIARERFPVHRTDRRIRRVYSHLIAAQHEAEVAETADETLRTLSECRLLIGHITTNALPYSIGADQGGHPDRLL